MSTTKPTPSAFERRHRPSPGPALPPEDEVDRPEPPLFHKPPKKYPARLSIDVELATRRELRIEAAEHGVDIVDIVREAIKNRGPFRPST